MSKKTPFSVEKMVEQAGFSLVDGRVGKLVQTAEATTNSLKVAQVFGRTHYHVLRDYRALESLCLCKHGCTSEADASAGQIHDSEVDANDDSQLPDPQAFQSIDPDAKTLDEFFHQHFWPDVVEVPMPNGGTRKEPIITMTRKGFEFMTLGFTGRKALMFRMAYIERFHSMERQILTNATAAVGTAYHKPPFSFRTIDYGKGATVTLKEPNPEHVPVPDGVLAAYNEDSMIFMRHLSTPLGRKH